MKPLIAFVVACAILAVIFAGCTSQPESPPVTPAATTTTPAVISPAPTPLVDPELVGTWMITKIGIQGGTAVLDVMNAEITATFDDQGSLGGSGGCNAYSTQYTLTGDVTAYGKGIEIGPIVSTKMYCVETAEIETTYFQILGAATSYTVDDGQTLSIRDDLGNVLIYKK